VLKNSKLALGRVKHSRLKGGATHTFEYPIFFSLVDLEEMERIGQTLWPIFTAYRKGVLPSFCCLSSDDHIKEVVNEKSSLLRRLQLFVGSKSDVFIDDLKGKRVLLLTHLSYFGYCFNPISIYYIKGSPSTQKKGSEDSLHCIVAEVSNTPWIEQHSYVLHESVKDDGGVEITRKAGTFEGKWDKVFHVSPFMEMDYQYNFVFSDPFAQRQPPKLDVKRDKLGACNDVKGESELNDKENIWVRAKMIKKKTSEVYFTASFQLETIAFNPLNLLYVLVFYPLHTRIIQLWIHWEAMLIWLKGVPFYNHPNDADVNFGFGITDKTLFKWILNPLIGSFTFLSSLRGKNGVKKQ